MRGSPLRSCYGNFTVGEAMERSSLIEWVALATALGARSRRFKPLLRAFHSPSGIFSAGESALLEVVPDMGKGMLATLCRGGDRREAERIVSYCEREGVVILTPEHTEYPSCFSAIAEPPVVLYCRGKLPFPEGVPYVGLVGAREIDAYGERVTYKLSLEMAAAGAVIVSGMALGADGIAAVGALEASGYTIAVLGCGIDIVYPKHHKRLSQEIAGCGVIVTEFAPGTPPNARNFPIRNRLISALSEALVVTQADEDSGSLITARYALLQGKSLFAVPGDVDQPRSLGCNMLLRAGARLVLDSEDVLSHFRFLYRQSMRVPAEATQYNVLTEEIKRKYGVLAAIDRKSERRAIEKARKAEALQGQDEEAREQQFVADVCESLDEPRRRIYDLLPSGAFTVDCLVEAGVPVGEAIAAMTLFEVYGLVLSRPGGTYLKK